jgi:hypothetical protein
MVVDDCCNCAAIHTADEAPICDVPACDQSTCSAQGVDMPAAVCRFGVCELAPIACNPVIVTCDSLPPACPDGQIASVADNGCWGPCVPAEVCDVVPDCSVCADDETCVRRDTQLGAEYLCEPIAAACAGVPACDCMDPCTEPYICADGGDLGMELTCSCPNC